MTDRKNDEKTSSVKGQDDWEFSSIQIKYDDEPKMESQVKDTRALHRKTKLALNEEAIPRSKTRSEMAKELAGDEVERDAYDLAAYPKRGLALALDVAFIAFIAALVKILSPFVLKIIHFFLDKYKLQLWFSDGFAIKGLIVLNALLAAFFFVVIPVVFFNASFGKKILGIRVRGEGQYSLSFEQTIKRELIFKPISILIVAGFVTPFFNKNRLSIHDMLAKTVVVES